ncbi:MAG: cell division protein FtsL [Lachnospiraceae bacterium]|nr:cell division protein FtsL [Lachnospiraceae bacterium]MBR4574518.1 cell division protein FtsL [Lachnospiraceae bacterium]
MAGRRNEYVYGNTARALRPIEKEIRSPGRTGAKSHRKINKESGMNPGFMIFMTLAMVLTGIVCVQYIRMQSSLTTYVNTISAMEIELQSLRAENDDYEKRINGAIGLENIKKRAMDELGMTYASDDQIVVYNSDGTDYVRQFVSLE